MLPVLLAVLRSGARPWPDALEAVTGQRDAQNKGQRVGWTAE